MFIKTNYNGKEITFDNLEYQRLDDCFECRGHDESGNHYSGIVHKSCDEYSEITDIEEILLTPKEAFAIINKRVCKLLDEMKNPSFDKSLTYGYEKALSEMGSLGMDIKRSLGIDCITTNK